MCASDKGELPRVPHACCSGLPPAGKVQLPDMKQTSNSPEVPKQPKVLLGQLNLRWSFS